MSALADQRHYGAERFARSETMVREKSFAVLISSLGYADALRFLTQLSSGQGDYLAWQDRVFGDSSADEIYEQARDYWGKHNSRV